MGNHEGTPFLVMELLEGKTLREFLEGGALPLRQALTYAAQATEGLIAAHAKGIVHRDLKPENLFVTADGRVKVVDFGLAKFTGGELATMTPRPAAWAETTPPATTTSPGVILGTIGYMAPEQIRGAAVDSRVDVFALGVVLFEMLAGRRPFQGSTPADVMSSILHEEPAPLTGLRPGIPSPLARLVRRCLAKDPDRRVQTVRDVRNELEDIVDELEHGASPDVETARGAMEPVVRQFPLTASHVRGTGSSVPQPGP